MLETVADKPVPRRKVTAQKVTVQPKKRLYKKRGFYCKVCKQGPFKNKLGVAIHGGKPQNVATHGAIASPRRVSNKNTDIKSNVTTVSELVNQWIDKAALTTQKSIREIYIDCALELKVALQK